MIAKNRISVYTDRYKNEHEKSPRGYGYWYFLCKGRGETYPFEFVGMYKEAKKKAMEFAAENDCYIVSLQS